MKRTVVVQLLPHDLERDYVPVGSLDFFTQREPHSGLCFLMFAVALSHFPRGLSQDLQEVAGTKLYYFTALIISVFCISAFFFPFVLPVVNRCIGLALSERILNTVSSDIFGHVPTLFWQSCSTMHSTPYSIHQPKCWSE